MKLRKHSLVDEACLILQKEIAGYGETQRLPSERVLAEKIGVSRPVLREAIGRLSTFGLLKVKHGSGVYVASQVDKSISEGLSYHLPDSSERMKDLLDFRLMVEPATVARIAEKVESLDLSDLCRIHHEMSIELEAKAISKQRFVDLDLQFHESLFSLADNKVLLYMMQSLRNLERSSKHLRVNAFTWSDIYKEHDAILKAIQKGKPTLAANRMRDHINHTINIIL